MNPCRGASCGAFRCHPCQRPRTFWHCPKGSWTSQRLAFLWAVREACAMLPGGFRWAPATSSGLPGEGGPTSAESRLIPSRSAWFAREYRVWDETRMNNLSHQHDSQQQDARAGNLGAARLRLWAMSPPSYVSAPPAHPVELRARRGNCRLARSARSTNIRSRGPCSSRLAQASRPVPWSCSNTGGQSHV
jgi:hypothetical protein